MLTDANGLIYIRFVSHRARQAGLAALKFHKPPAYWSTHRPSKGGIYGVTDVEWGVIRNLARAKFVNLRGPWEDLRPCWNGEYDEAKGRIKK